jgi:uncharacterized membrane protein YkvA (DUF1232 family)
MKTPWYLLRFIPVARTIIASGRLPLLLANVVRKGRAHGTSNIKGDLGLLAALCRAYWKGEYRAVNPKALLAIVAALAYFVSPLDLVPDWIPVLGLLDDMAVIGWVMKSWSTELEAFRRWRDQQPQATQRALDAPLEGERL